MSLFHSRSIPIQLDKIDHPRAACKDDVKMEVVTQQLQGCCEMCVCVWSVECGGVVNWVAAREVKLHPVAKLNTQ